MVTDRLSMLEATGRAHAFCPFRSTEVQRSCTSSLSATAVGTYRSECSSAAGHGSATAARAVVVLIRGDDEDDSVFADMAHGVAGDGWSTRMSGASRAAVVYGWFSRSRKPESGRGPNGSLRIGRQFGRSTGGAGSSSRTGSSRVLGVLRGNNTPTRRGWRPSSSGGTRAPPRFFDMHGVYAHLWRPPRNLPSFALAPDHACPTGRMAAAARSGTRTRWGLVRWNALAPCWTVPLGTVVKPIRRPHSGSCTCTRSRASGDLGAVRSNQNP